MIYLPLLISTSIDSGAFREDMEYNMPFDTLQKYGLYIKSAPFTIRPKPKNIIEQDWKDEDGSDVYLPETIFHEPYEMTLEFIYFRADGMANVNISAFVKEIEGKWLQMYESYTQIGRRAIYMSECDDSPTFKRRGLRDFAQFKITFKVNDPDTDIKLKI